MEQDLLLFPWHMLVSGTRFNAETGYLLTRS
jgi:hypothetical protein